MANSDIQSSGLISTSSDLMNAAPASPHDVNSSVQVSASPGASPEHFSIGSDSDISYQARRTSRTRDARGQARAHVTRPGMTPPRSQTPASATSSHEHLQFTDAPARSDRDRTNSPGRASPRTLRPDPPRAYSTPVTPSSTQTELADARSELTETRRRLRMSESQLKHLVGDGEHGKGWEGGVGRQI